MNKIKVKPRELSDLEREQHPSMERVIVRRPINEGGRPLKSGGELVLENSYWLRRLWSGDVVRVLDTPNKIETSKTSNKQRPRSALDKE